MDHHCILLNNCVGVMNMKYFYLFILYTGMLSVSTVCFNLIGLIFYIQRY